MEQLTFGQRLKNFFTWNMAMKLPIYFLVFLIPLFFLPWGVYKISFNKQFLVLFLVFFSFFGYLGKSLQEGKLIVSRKNKILFLFLFVSLISLFFSNSINVAIFGFNGAETDSFINIFSFGILFFIVSSFLEEKTLKFIFKLYLIAVSVLLLFQYFQLFSVYLLPFDFTQIADFNPVGTILSLAVFFGANLILFLNLLFNFQALKKTYLVVFTGLIFLYLLILNYSFVWLIIAISLVFSLLLKLILEGVDAKKINILIIFITLAFFLYFTPFLNIGGFLKLNFSPEVSVTLNQNLNIIKNTWFSNFKSFTSVKNFIFGTGGANFGYQYLKYRPVELNYGDFFAFSSIRFNSGYSTFFTYLVTLGLLGTFLFAFFVLNNFISSLKLFIKEKKMIIFPLLSFIFYVGVMIIVYNLSYVLLAMLFLFLGILKAARIESNEINLFSTPQRTFLFSLIIIILMICSLFGIYYSVGRMVASFYYDFAVSDLNKGDIDSAIVKMVNAISWDKRNDLYFRSLTNAFLNKLVSSTGAQSDLQNAINSAQTAINLNSVDSLNYINLAKAYETILGILSGLPTEQAQQQKENLNNSYNFALNNYKKAIELDPKNPELLLSIARLHLLMNNFKEAEKSINDSLVLKSDFSSAYFAFAQLYERQNKLKEAIEKAKEAVNFSPDSIGLVFQLGVLYYKDNQFDSAKIVFEKAVEIFDNYSNARYFLGLTYDKLGLKEKALEQFEKVLKFNPESSEMLKKNIENIKSGKSALESTGEALPVAN